jgi:hypothetical protein
MENGLVTMHSPAMETDQSAVLDMEVRLWRAKPPEKYTLPAPPITDAYHPGLLNLSWVGTRALDAIKL